MRPPPPASPASDAAARDALRRVLAERVAAADRRRAARPPVIRTANILAALREPGRAVELSRGMPLRNMVELVKVVWAEEEARSAAAARDAAAAGAPGRPRLG